MKYAHYPKYKDSGVEWLGEIPESWIVQKIGFGFRIQLGKMLQPESKKASDRLVSYLRAQNVQWNGIDVDEIKEMWANNEEIQQFAIHKGDLLICEGGEAGRSSLIRCELPDNCIIQNSLHRIRSISNEVGFLDYYMFFVSSTGILDVICNKSTIVHFTGEKLSALRLPLPPLSIQKSITSFLDIETTKVDGLIKDYKELIELLQEKRQALISHAVTRGLSELVSPDDHEFGEWAKPVTFKDSGVEWLGEIPEGWSVKRVKQVFSLVVDPAPEGNNEELLSIYTAIGVKPRKELEEKGNRATTTDGYWYVRKGDFIVNKLLAWMGAIGISDYNGVTSPAYDILRPKFKIAGYFYHELFRMNIFSQEIKRYSRGIMEMRLRLYFEEFGAINIPFPDLREQKAIERYICIETKKIDSLKNETESAIELLKEYRSALITNVVTGKINVEGLVKTR